MIHLLIYSFLLLDLVYFDIYRGIDYAVANDERLSKADELPMLVKQVMFYWMQRFEFCFISIIDTY